MTLNEHFNLWDAEFADEVYDYEADPQSGYASERIQYLRLITWTLILIALAALLTAPLWVTS